jgi:hypothetical protein
MTHIDGRAGGQAQTGDPFAMWDAAYVLGALSAEDRRQFEQHLTNCLRCREAVGELSGIPALLALLDRDEIAALDDGAPELSQPRPELLTSLLEKVSRRRRRTKTLSWSMAVAAAAAAVVALVIGIHVGGSAPSPAPPTTLASPLTMNPVAPSAVSATVRLTPQVWGTDIEMTCTYPKEPETPDERGDTLAMVIVGRDGSHTQLVTWLAVPGVTARPNGNSPMPIEQISAVQVVAADSGDVLSQRAL